MRAESDENTYYNVIRNRDILWLQCYSMTISEFEFEKNLRIYCAFQQLLY